jgi:hypothetical protein
MSPTMLAVRSIHILCLWYECFKEGTEGVTRKHWLFRQMPRTEQGTQLCSRYGFHRVQHFSFKSKLE